MRTVRVRSVLACLSLVLPLAACGADAAAGYAASCERIVDYEVRCMQYSTCVTDARRAGCKSDGPHTYRPDFYRLLAECRPDTLGCDAAGLKEANECPFRRLAEIGLSDAYHDFSAKACDVCPAYGGGAKDATACKAQRSLFEPNESSVDRVFSDEVYMQAATCLSTVQAGTSGCARQVSACLAAATPSAPIPMCPAS